MGNGKVSAVNKPVCAPAKGFAACRGDWAEQRLSSGINVCSISKKGEFL
jgi:hypothetical protein